MAEENPIQQTFSTIAQGYGGAQETLSRLGFTPGSFLPSDKGGAAPQLQTLPPPRFATVSATTLPFPSAAPAFYGAAAAPPPSLLPPMFQAGQPTFFPGMTPAFQQPAPPPPPPQMATFMPQPLSAMYGAAVSPANYTMPFTDPIRGSMAPPSTYSGGTFLSDLSMAGYLPRAFQLDAPGTGVNIAQQRYDARSRLLDTSYKQGGNVAGAAAALTGAAAGYGILKTAGFGLGALSLAGTAVTAPLAAVSYGLGRISDKIEDTRAVQSAMAGLTTGPLASPMGSGIDAVTASTIRRGLKANSAFSFDDYTTTLGMAQETGLMRGHTGSTSDVISRVKELARLTKTIMDLGQGITQKDAMEMQALAQNMGISTSKMQSQGVASKILASAKVTGQTMASIMGNQGAEGASLFGQLGMNAGAGLMTGVTSAATAATMINSGRLSARDISMLGGEAGLSSTLLKSVAGFQSGNADSIVMAALAGGGSLHGALTGSSSLGSSSKAIFEALNKKGVTKQQRALFSQFLEEQAPDILSQAQETLSPERMQQMMVNQAMNLMKNSKMPMTAFSAFKQVTGSEGGARALVKLMEDPNALRATYGQSRAAARESDARSIREYEEYSGVKSRAFRAIKRGQAALDDFLGVDFFSDEYSEADAAAQAESSGLDYYGRNRRNFASMDRARSRISEEITKSGMGGVMSRLKRAGNRKYSYKEVADEDRTMFGNLKNSRLAQKAFEDYGFSNSIFDFSYDEETIGEYGRTQIFGLGGRGDLTAKLQQKEYQRMFDMTAPGRDVARYANEFLQDPNAAQNFLTSGSHNKKMYRIAQSKMGQIIGSGNFMDITTRDLDNDLRGLSSEEKNNFKRLLGSMIAQRIGSSQTSEEDRGALKAALGKAGQVGELSLTGGTSLTLGRFNEMGLDEKSTKSLDDFQMSALELGVTSQQDYALLLETGGDKSKLIDIMNTSEGPTAESARKLLGVIERGDSRTVSALVKGAKGVRGKGEGGALTSREVEKISRGLFRENATAEDLKTGAAISQGLTDLGILNTVSSDTSETRTSMAEKFLSKLSGSAGSLEMMGKLSGAKSSEQVLEMLVTGAGGGSAAKLLQSPSYVGEINPILEEMRAEASGLSGLSPEKTAARLKELGSKLAGAVAKSGMAAEASAEAPVGTMNAVEAQIKAFSDIARMNKEAADILQKLVGDNGTAQSLTNAVNSLADKVKGLE
jgi:hypothetical protein